MLEIVMIVRAIKPALSHIPTVGLNDHIWPTAQPMLFSLA